ncbi:four-carbon acid sugar kinase family protein [Alteribacter lacisalsi]|uniref:four-carbon acid sugar kinase family protein n=1 Tax=Alteribacter lacisalsi TaxID=2045244 RepID=UPI001374EFD5|nr:four-carbon acid sugar kinase family protein [Alteribacter lacisalsi]
MKIGVIADDLTGANATGVKLVHQDIKTTTIMRNSPPPSNEDTKALCIDTDSRYCKKSEAAIRVKEAAQTLRNWGVDLIAKRIDSTIRGNIGKELDTLLEEMGEKSAVIVCPAYPDSGRTVVDGRLFVHRVPLEETDVAKDPVFPLLSSQVQQIIRTSHRESVIDLNIIEQGTEQLASFLRSQLDNGSRVIFCDSRTEEHVRTVGQAMARIKGIRLIPADPGPLTNEYVRALRSRYSGQILVSVGSATEVTRNQLRYFMKETGTEPLYVDSEKLASLTVSWEEEVTRVVTKALQHFNRAPVILVTTNRENSERLNLKSLAERENTSDAILAKRITQGLAEISRRLITSPVFTIKGCFFSGGDVTCSFCEAGGAKGISLKGEVSPLVAYGHLLDGSFDGLPVVTKGGMAGDNMTVLKSVEFLQSLTHQTKECFI